MEDDGIQRLLKAKVVGHSSVIDAPSGFDLEMSLSSAKRICIAAAFGKLSGWQRIKAAITSSNAESIRILLGRAFFQTDPDLVAALRELAETSHIGRLSVLLASVHSTFHPKIWIIEGFTDSEVIVGSGNLTNGGLIANVECGLHSKNRHAVQQLNVWFDEQWCLAPPLSATFGDYKAKYIELAKSRDQFNEKVGNAYKELASKEYKIVKSDSIQEALKYWKSAQGRSKVDERTLALSKMRGILKYPNFNFDKQGWSDFLGEDAFGHIVQIHKNKTIAVLADLQQALRNLTKNLQISTVLIDQLIAIPGIGSNLATKLLAIIRPEVYVVLNKPVGRALRTFGHVVKSGSSVTGNNYAAFLQDLQPFIDESRSLGLVPAAALDAFFYTYRGEKQK